MSRMRHGQCGSEEDNCGSKSRCEESPWLPWQLRSGRAELAFGNLYTLTATIHQHTFGRTPCAHSLQVSVIRREKHFVSSTQRGGYDFFQERVTCPKAKLIEQPPPAHRGTVHHFVWHCHGHAQSLRSRREGFVEGIQIGRLTLNV